MPPHRVPLTVTLVVACLLVPVAAADACAGATSPVRSNLARAASATHCLVNDARARSGRGRLHDAGTLDRAAGEHARDMVRRDFFDHVSPDGSTPAQRARGAGYAGASVGETIAWSSGGATPAAIVSMWMNSAPHRLVLLAGGFDVLGIGVAPGAPGLGGEGVTFTADLGS
ncbi:MAG: CAP domain-containing protein [Actinomycetota bacterium]|nr:CAP domain-containing protein [Actinomycetota bacterium]